MKGQKVYLVIEESAVEDLFDLDVRPYEKEEDAVKDWEGRKAIWEAGSDWEKSENGHSFEMWRDGEYSSNHVCLYLEEKEVE